MDFENYSTSQYPVDPGGNHHCSLHGYRAAVKTAWVFQSARWAGPATCFVFFLFKCTMYIHVFQWWTAFASAHRIDRFLFKNFFGRSRKSNLQRFPSLLVFKTRQNPRLNKFSMSGIYQIYQNFKTVSNITRDM